MITLRNNKTTCPTKHSAKFQWKVIILLLIIVISTRDNTKTTIILNGIVIIMFKKYELLNNKSDVKWCMLKAFHGLPITVKGVLMNIPSDFHWYTTMTKVSICILKESQDLKCHSIKCKFANKLRHIVKPVKKTSHFWLEKMKSLNVLIV